jgi:predicted dehydrogenase
MAQSRTYKAAIIGVGKAGREGSTRGGWGIGYTHAQMYRSNPRVKLTASADINPTNLRAFGKSFKGVRGYKSHKTMLREVKPDIVSIATYVGVHAEMIEAAARAGVRGIFCEKPFLASIPQCRRIEKVAAETGVKIVVAHVRRYRPAFIRAREIFNSGAIGKPVLCLAGIDGWDLSEWGSHWLDMFRFLNEDAPLRWVFGQARVRDARGFGHAMEEHAIAHFELSNGCRGLLDGGKPTAVGADILLIGSEGSIRIAGEKTLTITSSSGQAIETFGDDFAACWNAALDDLLAWTDGGPEPTIGLTSMLQTAELNLAAYLSAVRGDRVDFPLADRTDAWPVERLARRRRQPSR